MVFFLVQLLDALYTTNMIKQDKIVDIRTIFHSVATKVNNVNLLTTSELDPIYMIEMYIAEAQILGCLNAHEISI